MLKFFSKLLRKPEAKPISMEGWVYNPATASYKPEPTTRVPSKKSVREILGGSVENWELGKTSEEPSPMTDSLREILKRPMQSQESDGSLDNGGEVGGGNRRA